MTKVLIVGAGQSGLQTAIGLQRAGIAVTVVSDREPDQIRAGAVSSSQCMFDPALSLERNLQISLWEDAAPRIEGLSVNVGDLGGRPALAFTGELDRPALSVDQRTKLPTWIEIFIQAGGQLIIDDVSGKTLGNYAAGHDLVLVATGKAGLASLFPRDDMRSPYIAPQRKLALAYVHGFEPGEGPQVVQVNVIPGKGELFIMPCLTLTGPAHIIFWEAIPGGALDVFAGVKDPGERLRASVELLRKWLPWQQDCVKNVELTDAGATLVGECTPSVRYPVLEYIPGKFALGMADAVVLNDPITGQGTNNAARCAAIYQKEILSRQGRPFDRAWMEQTFEHYWSEVEPATRWTNEMLAPPKPHIFKLLAAAAENPAVARSFANGFAEPKDLGSFYFDPDSTEAHIVALSSAMEARS